MFRSASTRGGPGKYEKLDKETGDKVLLNEEFKRSTSVPAGAFNFNSTSRKMALGSKFGETLQRNPTTKQANTKEKSHPIFSFLDFRKKKKATARPEFARYLQYVKEGGIWESNSERPVIYYK